MAKVNKIDFYCGAFLSYLISNKVEPTLFNATEKSKVVQFLLKKTEYNIYVKYISAERQVSKKGKIYYNWNTVFQAKEYEFLTKNFYNESYDNNLVLLVCAQKNFKNTCFAALTFEQAIQCLGKNNINNQFRISVKHQKGSSNLYCYGTAVSDENAIKIPFDTDLIFGFRDKQ